MKQEFDEADEGAHWEGDHPIVILASERDAFMFLLNRIQDEIQKHNNNEQDEQDAYNNICSLVETRK
jgi:DUF438 domain-containing protein